MTGLNACFEGKRGIAVSPASGIVQELVYKILQNVLSYRRINSSNCHKSEVRLRAKNGHLAY